MGSGSSRNKVEKFDKGIQASGTKSDRFTSPPSSSLFKQTSSKPVKQQSKQDEHYRKLLQDYITQLDQIKANDLTDLQNQLQIDRERILEESQRKMMTVNEQANSIKAKILHDEQRQAGDKIDLIIGQLQQISHDDKLQHLSSEFITRTNIITNANFGSKAHFTFDTEQRPPSKNIREEKRVSVTQRTKFQ